ncbi:MAG TPA: winged helix-turn-helix domain-containing protein [Terriglobia bacterium]|nr:winged helix-turn-helix domain-containing protein [Terriglobia bacterium]
MSEQKQSTRPLRFGVFELDPQARELRRRGVRVKLQQKPFQILEMLLERAGEVVTRKDLRERLWPDTFVGFDRSLNTAVNALRRALADSPTNPRFIETRSRHGYRFIAPTDAGSAQVNTLDADSLDSIAVLPFRNASGDPEMEYLSDGITESLINALSQLPEIRVMARSTVFRYKAREVDPQAVGQSLNVRALVTGTVMQRAETLTIGAELVDATKGWRLWGERYQRKLPDIFNVQDEISREIAQKLRLRLTAEAQRRLTKRYTANPEAFQNYLRGRYLWNKMTEEGLRKGIVYFERAIEQDPRFALPWAGISDSVALFAFFGLCPSKEVMPRAEDAARKALALDNTVADAHASLAGILKSFHWDWSGAEAEYKRALELNPSHATARRWYANYLSALGRTEEALQEMHRALDLDPLSLIINMELAWIYYMGRDNGRAADLALRTLEMEPGFSPTRHVLGLAHEQMGKFKDAIQLLQEAHANSGGNPISLAALAHAYARANRPQEARKTLARLKALSGRAYVPPYAFAFVHAGLGDKSQSLIWLQKALEDRDAWLVWVQCDPRLDILREEPPFHELLRRMGF